MEPYRYLPGTRPLVISIPHAGTYVPPAILERFTAPAKRLPDTDWHVDRLYAFAGEMGAHLLIATHARYVADLNRPPDDASLYPGQFTTGLCPLTLFDGTPVYREGQAPDEAEVRERVDLYWRSYHGKLQALIAALKPCVLFDVHSIRSRVPALFDGRLPDLNLGTAGGASCDPALQRALAECLGSRAYSLAVNGRFKGGYITRHYGQPGEGVQAVQLELAQCNYMDEDYPYTYDEARAARLQTVLRAFVGALAG